MDAIPGERLHLDNRDELGLGGSWSGRHGGAGLASVGMVEWTGVVFAEPRVLKGVRVVDFVCLGKEEPEVAKRFIRDKLELGKGVLVGGGSSEIGHEGVDRCFG
jgi:hypothetical protein